MTPDQKGAYSKVRRWWRDRKTTRRLRVLVRLGWCPLCDSSPPRTACPVCEGWSYYGPALDNVTRASWAQRYVLLRTSASDDSPASSS